MKNDKKVLFVTSLSLSEIGGPAKVFSWLIEKLNQDKYIFKIVELQHQKKFYSNKIVNSLVKIKNLFNSLIKLLQNANSSDIIFATDSVGAGFPSLLVAKIFGRKFFLRLGGDQVWERYMEMNEGSVDLSTFFSKGLYKKQFVIYLISKIVILFADKVMVPAQLLADILIDHYHADDNKITVINNFFSDEIKNRPAIEKVKKKFLFVGRLINLKNVLFLSQCFIEAKMEDWQLLIVGTGYQKERLEMIAKQSNGKIILLGQKNRDEIRDIIYNQVDCLLLPSISDIFPNTVMEALASGVPCAVSKYTGFSADIKDSLYIFNSLNDKDVFINDLHNLSQVETLKNLQDKMKEIDWKGYSEDFILLAYKKFIYE